MEIICLLLKIYMVCLFGRAILSWFPISPESPIAPIASFLFNITEPVLAPVRSVIPAAGMIDISFIVVLLGLILLQGAICRGANGL